MIELKNVCLRIDKKKDIFRNLNFKVEKNQKLLLKMPSGTGKSTLLKIIMGYIPADKGDVFINEELLTEENIDRLRFDLAYVSQDIIFRKKNIAEYIDFIFSFKSNKDSPFDEKKLKDYFKKFELEDEILEKPFERLAEGEKQRIALIIVLLLDRKVLLLDEVTSGLNHDLKIKVIEILKDLEKTIIVSSHDEEWLDYDEFEKMEWSV